MPLKYSTPLTRKLFHGSRWLRATSSFPSDPSSRPPTQESRDEQRIRWAHRETDDPEPEPQTPQIRQWGARAWAATQTPMTVAESRKTHAGTLRIAHGLTVCIHNVPPQASIGEVLDIVLAGPIFDVKDSVQNGSRTVSVTFFHRDGAHNFYSDVKSREINLYGYRPEFSWARGESPRWSPGLGRSIVIWDKGQLGTEEDILRYLSLYGPMERITLMKERIADRAFVNFLNAESGAWVRISSAYFFFGSQVVGIGSRRASQGRCQGRFRERSLFSRSPCQGYCFKIPFADGYFAWYPAKNDTLGIM